MTSHEQKVKKEAELTLSQLKALIPKACFEKSLAMSMFYLARDIGTLLTLVYFRDVFFALPFYIGEVIWWNLMGFFMWCLFVVGHDCGHGSFSAYPMLNFVVGVCAHSPLCVPFSSWAISHRKHHLNHNHIEKDHSWKPFTKSEYERAGWIPTGILRFSYGLLWLYPIYLLNESNESGFSGNHFNPFSPLFTKKERTRVTISVLGVLAWITFLHSTFPFFALLKLYWAPYLVFVAWLDLVTFLQHTDEKVSYYRGEAWSYLTGALSTVDRTYAHLIDPFGLGYGYLLDNLHHNISDGHVIHHLFFTSIPHYHLIEATKAVLPALGEKRVFDDTPVPIALYNSLAKCHYVDDHAEICKYEQSTDHQMPTFYTPTKNKKKQ